MFRQVLATARKEFWDSFTVPLSHYPVATRVLDTTLLGELLADGTVLVFGRYELAFCYKDDHPLAAGYHTVVVPRTFGEKIQPAGSWATGPLAGEVELQLSFSRPLRVHTRPGRPARFSLVDWWKNILSYPAWVEVQVEGEITAEIALVAKSLPELPRMAGGGLPEAEKKEGAEAGSGVSLQPEPPRTGKSSGNLAEQEVPARDQAAESGPLTLDVDLLVDLVLRVLRQRERSETGAQGESRQEPRGEAQVVGPAPAAISTADTPLPSLPLEQIPSRPGLYRAFQPYVPPPKPPGKGG